MAGYACPCCGDISDTFGRGGGEDMAKRNGVGFLGRVPIDTVLVGLLDAVSKGEIPAAGVTGEVGSEVNAKGFSGEKGQGEVEGEFTAATTPSPGFPLLDRYLETTSARVWKDITRGIIDGIETRKDQIRLNLDGLSISSA